MMTRERRAEGSDDTELLVGEAGEVRVAGGLPQHAGLRGGVAVGGDVLQHRGTPWPGSAATSYSTIRSNSDTSRGRRLPSSEASSIAISSRIYRSWFAFLLSAAAQSAANRALAIAMRRSGSRRWPGGTGLRPGPMPLESPDPRTRPSGPEGPLSG
ncbi:hypothetical protein GCM10010343_12360 [Streptomyces avidinii]|nr:hypothetical protein GCM10010343_12360 [Streptomyces avidinii]